MCVCLVCICEVYVWYLILKIFDPMSEDVKCQLCCFSTNQYCWLGFVVLLAAAAFLSDLWPFNSIKERGFTKSLLLSLRLSCFYTVCLFIWTYTQTQCARGILQTGSVKGKKFFFILKSFLCDCVKGGFGLSPVPGSVQLYYEYFVQITTTLYPL